MDIFLYLGCFHTKVRNKVYFLDTWLSFEAVVLVSNCSLGKHQVLHDIGTSCRQQLNGLWHWLVCRRSCVWCHRVVNTEGSNLSVWMRKKQWPVNFVNFAVTIILCITTRITNFQQSSWHFFRMLQMNDIIFQTIYHWRQYRRWEDCKQHCENCKSIFCILLPNVVPWLILASFPLLFLLLLLNAVSMSALVWKTANEPNLVSVWSRTKTHSLCPDKILVCWHRRIFHTSYFGSVLTEKSKSPNQTS